MYQPHVRDCGTNLETDKKIYIRVYEGGEQYQSDMPTHKSAQTDRGCLIDTHTTSSYKCISI